MRAEIGVSFPVQFLSLGSVVNLSVALQFLDVMLTSQVNITRPGGTNSGGSSERTSITNEVNVTVQNNVGADVKTQRRRDASGREKIEILVNQAVSKAAETRRGAANALLDDSGARRAPCPGID